MLKSRLSLLLLGRPGVGKTTLLRDIARLMSLTPERGGLGLSVVIVDTSNEIAGNWVGQCYDVCQKACCDGEQLYCDTVLQVMALGPVS